MSNRPQTKVVLAMTADGKIADVERRPARFSSKADRKHLERQIASVDGVLFGAATLRAYGTTITISNPHLLQRRIQQQKPPQPRHIVCSASGNIDPQRRFFQQEVPRWLLTTAEEAASRYGKEDFEQIIVVERKKDQKIDWSGALERLAELGIAKLAVLGGGELVASLLAEDLLDEFWLTVCPVIFGGATAPTLVEGVGFAPQQAKQLELIEVRRVAQEIFLHYRRKY